MAVTFSDSTGTTWVTWCDDSRTTSATTSSVWSIWTSDSTTTCASVTTNTAWGNWVVCSDSSAPTAIRAYTPESEEERQERLEQERIRREERQRQDEERKVKEAEANKKADELLKSLLTPEQVEQLDSLSCFIVTTPKGNTYRVKRGWSGNVEKLNEEQKATERYCLHPSEHVPNGDNMIAQLLMLQTEEDRFLEVSNKTRIPVAVN